jgi:parallel beta-helix repeat protein
VAGCSSYGLFVGTLAVVESCRAHDNNGGAAILTAFGAVMTNCTADHNTVRVAIGTAGGSSLTNCVVRENTGLFGITVGDGSSLMSCSASGNGVAFAIYTGTGSSLTNCSAISNNGGGEPMSAGITAGFHSVLDGCTASLNTSTAASSPTAGMGFDIGGYSSIHKCTAVANRGDGIAAKSNCVVSDNLSAANGMSGDGAGIHASQSDNRIEGNNLTGNKRGIDVDAAGNFIVKNSASGNVTNYDLVANNFFGTIVDRTSGVSFAVTGNSAATSIGTTDPWANISY